MHKEINMLRKLSPHLIAVIALVLFLMLAYGFDLLVESLKQANSESSALSIPVLWVYALGELVIAAAFLWLSWYLLHIPRHRYLPALFLVLGLLVILAPVFYYSPLHSTLGAALTPSSMFFTAGALSAATGLLALVIPARLPKSE
jgi:uncharacterized membrane protein